MRPLRTEDLSAGPGDEANLYGSRELGSFCDSLNTYTGQNRVTTTRDVPTINSLAVSRGKQDILFEQRRPENDITTLTTCDYNEFQNHELCTRWSWLAFIEPQMGHTLFFKRNVTGREMEGDGGRGAISSLTLVPPIPPLDYYRARKNGLQNVISTTQAGSGRLV